MRIALFSDIHGNPVALNAVLTDIDSLGGADQFWVLGDFSALGYDPVAPLNRIVGLPNLRAVRGNTDRYSVSDERPGPSLEEAKRDPNLVGWIAEVEKLYAWTRGYLSARGWTTWLEELPLEVRVSLPDGTRVLGVHAAPGLDDGDGIHPELSDSDLAKLLEGCQADLIIVGHTHWPLDRRIGEVRVVNLGSVSNQWAPDIRASYFLLDCHSAGYALEHRRVDYDKGAVLEAARQAKCPGEEFLVMHMRGQMEPKWLATSLGDNAERKSTALMT